MQSKLETLWTDYCDASRSIGHSENGNEEFDIEAMNDAAWALYQFAQGRDAQGNLIPADPGIS